MRATLEEVRRRLGLVRDELVHQQAMAKARNQGKPSRSLTVQLSHVDAALEGVDEAIDEEDCRDRAREARGPIDVDLDAWAKARGA